MQELVRDYLNDLKSKKRKRRRISIAIAAFAVLVIGGVVWSLARSGIAMTGDPRCGVEEHTHSEACYTAAYICGMEESEGHIHTDACYQTESVLACGMEESEEHVHDDSCYSVTQTLICGQEENAGHTHTEACQSQELTCGLPEHTHTDACYTDAAADVEDASKWDADYANVEWKDAWGEDLKTAAEMQIGYKESTKNYTIAEDGSHKGYTRYGQFAGDAYADWDASFVNFCLHYAGLEQSNMFPNEKVTTEWYDKFVQANETNQNYLTAPEGYEPKAGDIIFFHKENEETDTQMGIVSSYDKEKNEIKVIEGNSGNEVKENKYDAADTHITSYLMITEMEKVYKEANQPAAPEENTEASEEEKQIFTTENNEENWVYDNTYEDDTIVIHVRAGEGVVPEGAELSVTPIEQKEVTDDMTDEEAAEAEKVNEQYEFTNQKLQEESEKNNEVLGGFLAYDICFIVDGEEVEPSGDVKVTMDFKEATKPEGVTEDAVVAVKHLKEDENAADGIVVEDLTEKEATTIATVAEDAAVEKVEVVAESFSTFVITWGAGEGQTRLIPVKYVDQYGVEFVDVPEAENTIKELELTPAMDLESVDLKKYLNPPSELQMESGKCIYKNMTVTYFDPNYGYKGEYRTYPAEYVYYDALAGSIAITNGSYNEGLIGGELYVELAKYSDIQLQVVYTKSDGALRKVDTVDSSSQISLKMINYDAMTGDKQWSPFYGDGGADQAIVPGILSDKLGKDGYPTFAMSGLTDAKNKTSISAGYSLSKLFPAGEMKTANKLFSQKEYNATGDYYYNSQETAAVFNENTGEFTVYNELVVPHYDAGSAGYHTGNFLPYNTIGQKRSTLNPKFYIPDGSTEDSADGTNADYHFGMEMSANFLQPKDGLHKGSNQPVKYEFDGDDDLWVYIDGVLVLDIGGIHSAKKGSIDFATGEITVEGQSVGTLKSRFEAVLNGPNATAADKEKFANIEWKGNTFADYTAHTFKMWYMERGAGASDLKIRFNLTTIDEDTVNLTKRLKDEDGNYVFNSDKEFGFKVYCAEAEDSNYELLTNADLSNGIIKVRPEETVAVKIPKETPYYYVEEVDLNTSQYDAGKVVIYSTANGSETPTVKGNNIASEKASAASRKSIIFTNQVKSAGGPITKVHFEKKWDDLGDVYETRPDKITVALHGEIQKDGSTWDINDIEGDWIGNNVKGYEQEITGENWTYDWSNLPTHYTNERYVDQKGEVINYAISWTVKEEGTIPAYEAGDTVIEDGPDSSTKYLSITNKIDVDWQMVKCSVSDKTKTLKGAEFQLKKDILSNEVLATSKPTDDSGEIKWEPTNGIEWNDYKKTLNGKYVIIETQAPEGYLKSPGSWDVTFVEGIPQISGLDFDKSSKNNRTVITIYITNSLLYALPGTGGSGIYWYMFSGVLLMAAAVLITYKKRRKGVLRS